jgi:hypothetical protein
MSKTKKGTNISVFLDEAGKITQIPVPNRTRIPVLAYLASKFEGDRFYSEKEVNGIINAWHSFGDYFILRRLLIDYQFLKRTPDGSRYWVLKMDNEKGDSDGQEKRTQRAIQADETGYGDIYYSIEYPK